MRLAGARKTAPGFLGRSVKQEPPFALSSTKGKTAIPVTGLYFSCFDTPSTKGLADWQPFPEPVFR